MSVTAQSGGAGWANPRPASSWAGVPASTEDSGITQASPRQTVGLEGWCLRPRCWAGARLQEDLPPTLAALGLHRPRGIFTGKHGRSGSPGAQASQN